MTLTIDGEIVDLARQRLKFHKEQAEKHTAAAERIEKRLAALDALMSELVDGFGLSLEADVEPPAQIEAPKQPEPDPEPPAPPKKEPPQRGTIRQAVKDLFDKAPHLTVREAADRLNLSEQQVYNVQYQLGFKFGHVSAPVEDASEPEEEAEEPVTPRSPIPSPEPPVHYHKPVPVPRHTPVPKQPAGTEFRLQDPETGKYLHQDLNAMLANNGELHLVENKDYAWKGVEAKLLHVRRILPDTMDLREVAIVKVPA